nr:MAG TPA: hypothetical protein [Caudoviricetes sp.]
MVIYSAIYVFNNSFRPSLLKACLFSYMLHALINI